ncbi:MAG: hypothetical protein V1828_02425 [Candidatus Omnitrophota bacterium]
MRKFIEKPDWTKKLKGYFPNSGIEVLTDGIYIVEVHNSSCEWGDSIRLCVKRIDKKPIHSWGDLQEIKNQIAGEERIAIEIYPKQDQITDEGNMYHLWVLPKDFGLPYRLVPYKDKAEG